MALNFFFGWNFRTDPREIICSTGATLFFTRRAHNTCKTIFHSSVRQLSNFHLAAARAGRIFCSYASWLILWNLLLQMYEVRGDLLTYLLTDSIGISKWKFSDLFTLHFVQGLWKFQFSSGFIPLVWFSTSLDTRDDLTLR